MFYLICDIIVTTIFYYFIYKNTSRLFGLVWSLVISVSTHQYYLTILKFRHPLNHNHYIAIQSVDLAILLL